MNLGAASIAVLIITLAWVIMLLLERINLCRFWRNPSHDRRCECAEFDGEDRRRKDRPSSPA